MTRLVPWYRARRKAIAGLLTPIAAWAVMRVTTEITDLTLPAGWSSTLVAVITGVTVHEIPNTTTQEG